MNVVVDAHRLQRRGIKLAEQDHHDLFEPRIRSQPLQDLLHVEPWHRDVEQQDIRPLKLDLRERAIRTGQTRHLKPGPRKPVLGFENIHDVAIEDENLSTQHGFAGQEGGAHDRHKTYRAPLRGVKEPALAQRPPYSRGGVNRSRSSAL